MTDVEPRDEFEREHARGEGHVFFRDKVPVPGWFLPASLVGIAAMAVGLALSPLGPAVGVVAGIGLGAFALLANLGMLGLRIVVSEAGVDVFAGASRRRLPFAEIERVELGEFQFRKYPFGRGVVRRGLDGSSAYLSSWSVRKGVLVHLAGGRSVLITSNDPQGLAEAIERGRAPKVRVEVDAPLVTQSAADEVEVEVPASPARDERDRGD